MSHSHNHSHGTSAISDNVLLWSIALNVGLSVFEFIAGAIAGSVALMADALHNTNDAAALLIAFVARKIARRDADLSYTFGYRRAELVGAMIQLTALIVVGLFLFYEAINRFLQPEPILGGWMIAAAGVALLVDIATAWLLWSMAKGSLNAKAAFLHNLTDAGASIAVLLGGLAVYKLGWTWVDPAVTLLIAGYIVYMSFGLMGKTARILMEGAPPDLDIEELGAAVKRIEGVRDLHHLHVWELNEDQRALEAHVEIADGIADRGRIRVALKRMLHADFDIEHSTIELETPPERALCHDAGLIAGHRCGHPSPPSPRR